MDKETIVESIKDIFKGHNVAVASEHNYGGVHMLRLMVSGNSFALPMFQRVGDAFGEYKVDVLIESNVLVLNFFREV